MKTAISIIVAFLLFAGCMKESVDPDYGSYPADIGKIIVPRCATSGCHNSISKDAAAGLDLSDWNSLFRGGKNNSVVIPFRPDQSYLSFAINHFPELGPILTPTMPLGGQPLEREEIQKIQSWISQGAPDASGKIKFAEDPDRSKIYVANQGCDLVTVFDAETRLIMRAIDVGNNAITDAPHDMWVSPDGEHLYISYYTSNVFQRFSTRTGAFEGEVNLTDNSWHSMSISGDSKYALTTHLDANGQVALIDLDNFSLVVRYQGSSLFIYPHGNALNYNGKLAYITAQQGNFLYKVDLTDPQNPDIMEIPLQPGTMPSPYGTHKPYEVEFSPDYSKYFVTCQGTNEVRMFSATNDSLLAVIPTSGVPQTMGFTNDRPYLFVTCMEDSSNVNSSSAVDVINYQNGTFITSVNSGYQPRGMAVDEANGVVYVANRNISPVNWVPHHTTSCSGRYGYITLIDINTLQLVEGWKTEVGVDPYTVAIKK